MMSSPEIVPSGPRDQLEMRIRDRIREMAKENRMYKIRADQAEKVERER